jgi:hypothetical protein
LSEVEITEMSEEYLIGMAFMRSICKRAIFSLDDNKITFEE